MFCCHERSMGGVAFVYCTYVGIVCIFELYTNPPPQVSVFLGNTYMNIPNFVCNYKVAVQIFR